MCTIYASLPQQFPQTLRKKARLLVTNVTKRREQQKHKIKHMSKKLIAKDVHMMYQRTQARLRRS